MYNETRKISLLIFIEFFPCYLMVFKASLFNFRILLCLFGVEIILLFTVFFIISTKCGYRKHGIRSSTRQIWEIIEIENKDHGLKGTAPFTSQQFGREF